jgi:hypothetical protein
MLSIPISIDDTLYTPSTIPTLNHLPPITPIGSLSELTQFIDKYEQEEGYQSNIKPTLYETAPLDSID